MPERSILDPTPLGGLLPIRALACDDVPSWVVERVASAQPLMSPPPLDQPEHIHARIRTGDDAALVSVRLPGARALSAPVLRERVVRAYDVLRDVSRQAALHPVRIWNFIPGITEPLDNALDRYMAFNLGRHDMVQRWFGSRFWTDGLLPTASGVGHRGDDLAIHALMLLDPPRAIENPRQRPAYHYSSRYGPLPPCFVRASAIRTPQGEALLIGGTASIRGEQTRHRDSLPQQIEETFENIESLIRSFTGNAGSDPLQHLHHVRAYVPDPRSITHLQEAFACRLPGRTVELIEADLCRSELQVEIEGVAHINPERE